MFKNNSFWCIVLVIVVIMITHHIISDKPLIEGNENNSNLPECLVAESSNGVLMSPDWFNGDFKSKCVCPKSKKENGIMKLEKDETKDLYRCREEVLDPNNCMHLKKSNRIYDVTTVNKCLNHLGKGQIYSKTDSSGDPKLDPEPISAFEFNKNAKVTRDNNLHIYCGKTRGEKVFNDLCKTFGHKTLNEKFIKDQPDSNTYIRDKGYFPNRKECKLRDTDNEFIKQVGMHNGSGHKQTLKIKCDD